MASIREEIIEYGKELGFPIIKITDTAPLNLWEAEIKRRSEKDTYLNDYWTKRSIVHNPLEYMEDAKSIIVALYPYNPHGEDYGKGFGAYSAHYIHYPRGLELTRKLSAVISEKGYKVIVNPNLPMKALAVKSGIGYYGKNGIIHTREYGSFATINIILTNAKLVLDPNQNVMSDCGFCSKCIKACPTGAIMDNGEIIVNKCLRHHMLSGDFVPLEYRDKMGTMMLGCEICQRSCHKNTEVLNKDALYSKKYIECFDIGAILREATGTGLKDRLLHIGELIGKNYARAWRVVSSAVIAAGNMGDCNNVSYLKKLLCHPHPPIRAHAAWALRKIVGPEIGDTLLEVLNKENNPIVVDEIKKYISE